jgi:hypothetical protein
MTGRILALLGLLAVVAAPAANAQIINGGFETGNFSGWSLSGNGGFISIVGGGLQHSGNDAASFGAVGSPTFLSQTIATVAGDSYALSFWLRNDGGAPNLFRAEWDGNVVTNMTNVGAQPYTQYTYNVTASTNSTQLKFSFQNDPSFWRFDDVAVQDLGASSVPEPGNVAMMAGLLAPGALYLIRRKRA